MIQLRFDIQVIFLADETFLKEGVVAGEDMTSLNSPNLRSFSLPGRSGSPGGGGGMV